MLAIRILLCAAAIMTSSGCGHLMPGTDAPGTFPAQTLAKGAIIAGANGMHFGPDGLLYVASVIGSEIVVLDPESGEVIRRITEGVNSPDDIAFASDGSFYWTSILSGEVAGRRADGTRVRAAQLTPGVNPITFSPDDRLFVSQCFFDDKLYEVDPEGIEAPRLLSDQLGPGCGLNGMDWGPDDRLYGPRWFRGEIVSFDVDTREMRTVAEGFDVPAAVKFDSRGRLHVLDTGTGQVIRLDEKGRTVIATLTAGLDNLAFDSNDRLFVSSFVDGFVARVEADGTSTMIAPSGLAHPGGLVLRTGEAGTEIIVADLSSLRGFDARTGEPTFVERNVLGVGEMGSVTSLATDGPHLILTSWLDGTVKVWDPAARRVIESHTHLAGPVSALRYAGRLVVAEHTKGRVVSMNSDESLDPEVLVDGLPAPTGLVERAGDLFVTDREQGTLLRIARAGSALEKPEVVASGLPSPEGVAVTKNGFVIVDGENGHVFEVDDSGETHLLSMIPPGNPAPSPDQPPSMIFNGVAVGEDGLIYATGETHRVVYRIDRR